jgi:NAD(P)H dehydrogenase (quinone)
MAELTPKILVLFYSMYGHVYAMAQAVVEGVIEAGGEPILKQVEELVPEKFWNDVARNAKELMSEVPVADPFSDLKGIDGLVVGTPTRFGNMCAQMREFWDQTGADFAAGTLTGKPAAVFASSNTQHGGQETTIITTMITLLHHGAILVGLPYTNQEQSRMDEITGGSPYGASTIAGQGGSRQPSENELLLAKRLGIRLTEVARKLMA